MAQQSTESELASATPRWKMPAFRDAVKKLSPAMQRLWLKGCQ